MNKNDQIKESSLVFEMIHRLGNELGLITSYVNQVRDQLSSRSLEDDVVTSNLERITRDTQSALSFLQQIRNAMFLPDMVIATDIKDALLSAIKRVNIPDSVKVETDLESHLPEVVGTPSLTGIFITLIDNAVDAMPTGGNLSISSRINDDQSMVSIDVSDTGSGITANLQEKLFKSFITTKKDGLGMGLRLSHYYLQELGGSIDFESIVGKGTKFTVTLPTFSGRR